MFCLLYYINFFINCSNILFFTFGLHGLGIICFNLTAISRFNFIRDESERGFATILNCMVYACCLEAMIAHRKHYINETRFHEKLCILWMEYGSQTYGHRHLYPKLVSSSSNRIRIYMYYICTYVRVGRLLFLYKFAVDVCDGNIIKSNELIFVAENVVREYILFYISYIYIYAIRHSEYGKIYSRK